MKSNSVVDSVRGFNRRCLFKITLIAILIVHGGGIGAEAQQCSFTSPSDGSDGDYDLTATPLGTTVYFKASAFKGSGVTRNIFNFKKIIIPAGVTVKFSENTFHGPVYWLASGDVTIAGTLDLNGDPAILTGTDPTLRQPSAGGSGGYPGGLGGSTAEGFIATPGGGPGGGIAGVNGGGGYSGVFAGTNDFLVPLVGGSGGGGGYGDSNATHYGSGGAGGGGAIMIAGSTSISFNGSINADGGSAGNCGSAGSGGSILLVADLISGGGSLDARGGSVSCAPSNSTDGLIRLEACNFTYNGPEHSRTLVSTPVTVYLPSTPSPALQVTSVNGTPVTENPFTFPDVKISTTSSIPVVITAHYVPLGTIPKLYIFSENGDQQLQCPAPGLQGTTIATSTCTVNLAFPFGGSRGFVKATWAQ